MMQAFALDTVDSTNEEAKRLIRRGELRGSAYVLAREQTSGRGSRGRSWASPRDAGIYLSVVELPDGKAIAPTAVFTLATGVACVEALIETAGAAVQLKPVNDLYVDGRKLGGILTETLLRGGKVEALITGVGINVHRADRDVSAGGAEPICLAEVIPPDRFAQLDISTLTAALVARIHRWNAMVFGKRLDEVRRAWDRHKIPGTVLPKS
ncbi:MAG: biotin--[acetyl-CoA-carboxylase] ligase [Planctomycetes bacterium]|nr:biotin--[acetyl-CoA-carboxylase] ligase [Planctomycetota bacterium]